MTITDLRNVSCNCLNSWEVLEKVCGKNNISSLYSFQKNFERELRDIKSEYPYTRKVCIPLKHNRYTTLADLLILSSIMRVSAISGNSKWRK